MTKMLQRISNTLSPWVTQERAIPNTGPEDSMEQGTSQSRAQSFSSATANGLSRPRLKAGDIPTALLQSDKLARGEYVVWKDPRVDAYGATHEGGTGVANVLLKRIVESYPQAGWENDLKSTIGLELFLDPVLTPDGHTYEADEIASWLKHHATSPNTGAVLTGLEPNRILGLPRNFAIRDLADYVRGERPKVERSSQPLVVTVAQPRTHGAAVNPAADERMVAQELRAVRALRAHHEELRGNLGPRRVRSFRLGAITGTVAWAVGSTLTGVFAFHGGPNARAAAWSALGVGFVAVGVMIGTYTTFLDARRRPLTA